MNTIHTSCKDCCFASYVGKTQESCRIWYLKKFDKNIIEAYDDDKEFYIIDGRVCPGWRSYAWYDSLKKDELAVERLLKEISIKCNAIVYVDSTTTDEQLWTTLRSISKQVTPFKNAIIVINNGKISLSRIRQCCNELNLKWRIEICVEEMSMDDAIHIGAGKGTSSYFTFCKAGYEYKSDFLSKLDYALNVECTPFLVLTTDDTNGMVIQRMLYNLLGGSTEKPFLDKLETVIRNQEECTNLIMPLKNIIQE